MQELWNQISEKGLNIAEFFYARGYTDIAVYGDASQIQVLEKELENEKVKICYVIRKKEEISQGKSPIYYLGDVLPKVDVIVVMEKEDYLHIEKEICEANRIEVISLDELLRKVCGNSMFIS